jgi:hypothetical protein
VSLRAVIIVCCLAAAPLGASVGAENRHVGYYYPDITSTEVYESRARVLDQANRRSRLSFVVGMNTAQAAYPYPPRYAIFAKGDEAQKLIVVGLDGESFRTLYRARAVLAQLTARARSTELFRNLEVDDLFTFFDLLRMLGFDRVTVSDGETYAHQVDLQ